MSVKETIHSFYLKLMVISYKLNENKELSPKQKKMIKCLEIVIPMFDELMERQEIITMQDITENSLMELEKLFENRWFFVEEQDELKQNQDNDLFM